MRPKSGDLTHSPETMDDEDYHAHDDHGKTSSSSSQVRKAQNRIAQREFRLRKQQYVRDLEARVEVLSADKEDRVELMTLIIRNLLKENKELRGMVRSMASFVGEGLGSCMPRLGLTATQLDAILNRQDTETAHEAFVALKASREALGKDGEEALPFGATRSSSTQKRKRGSTDDHRKDSSSSHHGSNPTPVPPERQNSDGPLEAPASQTDYEAFSYLFPGSNSTPYAAPQNSTPYSAPLYMQQPVVASPGLMPYGLPTQGFGLTVPPPVAPYPEQEVYSEDTMGGTETERHRQLRAAVANFTNGNGDSGRNVAPGSQAPLAGPDQRRRIQEDFEKRLGGNAYDRKTVAYQLVNYHINN